MEKRELSESEKGTEHVVRSGSRLTIETIAEFVQQIRKALNEASTVVIEFDRDVEMDITALQVFYASCNRRQSMENTSFVVARNLKQCLILSQPPVRNVMGSAGITA